VISTAYIQEWAATTPWPDPRQVEQDLIVCRALCDIFAEPYLAERLAFRGGTAINKLLFRQPLRYSEDIDLVQVRPEPIGKTVDAIRHTLSWLGPCRRKSAAHSIHLVFNFSPEAATATNAKLKVEINTRDHEHLYGIRSYEAIGYTVLLPASAIPGWPADVVLPSDPVWKRDYSGSVRRLVRDGVDSPLASLFVHVARPVPPDADGAQRARSASEAFLFRRLETLAATKGRFAVNTKLPIPFDGTGTLEVDLLCADARVAVELDGAQHLADRVAYRRDRRKDQLLQESGYLVLRFLAEDLGRDLDAVLDAILRVLSHRASPGSTAGLHFIRGARS
jgi:very-short-patch-repair endonuclease